MVQKTLKCPIKRLKVLKCQPHDLQVEQKDEPKNTEMSDQGTKSVERPTSVLACRVDVPKLDSGHNP